MDTKQITQDLRTAFEKAEKPSELLTLALMDAQIIRSMPKHNLAMGVWLDSDDEGNCYVCLAGAIMVRRYDVPIPNGPDHFGKPIRDKLHMINNIRTGWVFPKEMPEDVQVAYWNTVQEATNRLESSDDRVFQQGLRQYQEGIKILAAAGY